MSRHGSVEYLTTMRYIEKYLRPGMRVLEVGAATGRYSHTLAKQGYQVDAVELVQHNIDIFNSKTEPEEKVTIRQGDARDLSCFEDDTFDMTLVLGPMYHLFTPGDQKKALAEAIRVTKKGGIVCAAYCGNEATMVQYCFGRGMIRQERYRNLVDPVTFKASSDPAELFQLYRREDIDRLMADFNVTRLHYVGTDMATNYMRDVVDGMDDDLFSLYLQYHFTICERPDCVGTSHHILDVFRKE
jgi:ubiquinone/menaquinone biosynthesis C-methylase UbiE